jgi:hypothetical protein
LGNFGEGVIARRNSKNTKKCNYESFRFTKIFDPGKERGAYFFEGFPESFEEIWFEELYG